jgi:hypothetical protein
MSEQQTKVARPATPGLDLLNDLGDTVFRPAMVNKLAKAGIPVRSQEDVQAVVKTGAAVSQAIDQTLQQKHQPGSPVQQGAQKAAAAMNKVGYTQGVDQQINDRIAQNQSLSSKFAAALG